MVRSSNKRRRGEVEVAHFSLVESSGEHDLFRRTLARLYGSQTLCDVTFAVHGVRFHAHKVILAASSW
ncbi:MAG: BTB/POZ domain-containing protein [Sphingobacteriales bacterium]|nr:MAG: BTB/POZ domain-containing protein [Sphingobacteriales bacterium]